MRRRDPEFSTSVPTLCVRWRDGPTSVSQHMTWRLLVQYLHRLAALGEAIEIVWVDARPDIHDPEAR